MGETSVDQVKLGGAKRKNGHKLTCTCHICENMKNKAKRGGYSEELKKKEEYISGGSKKKNGHRKSCKCPICKNMNNSKKNRKGGMRKTRKMRGGDDSKSDEGFESDEDSESDEESESDNESESDEESESDNESDEETIDNKKGGKRKRQRGKGDRKKGNGHKPECKCPICLNMRKGKKGGQEPTDSNEVVASDNEYDSLDNLPSSGGSRKKRCKKSKCKSRRRHN